MLKKILVAALLMLTFSTASMACVGKTLIIGAEGTKRGKVAAQVLAILINERTGTTVKIVDFADPDSLHKELTTGDVDIAVEFTARALGRLGAASSGDAQKDFAGAKTGYMESYNLVWLPPLGYEAPTGADSIAAPVAQKHALKKFPALPRLIAKAKGVLTEEVMTELAGEDNAARAARGFLRLKKLI